MDGTTAAVIIVALFTLVAVASFVVFRHRTRVRISRQGLDLESANAQTVSPPSVVVDDSTAGQNIRAHDRTGQGVTVHRSRAVRGDIDASSSSASHDPKD